MLDSFSLVFPAIIHERSKTRESGQHGMAERHEVGVGKVGLEPGFPLLSSVTLRLTTLTLSLLWVQRINTSG